MFCPPIWIRPVSWLITGISVLTSRSSDNLHPTASACNASARVLTEYLFAFHSPRDHLECTAKTGACNCIPHSLGEFRENVPLQGTLRRGEDVWCQMPR